MPINALRTKLKISIGVGGLEGEAESGVEIAKIGDGGLVGIKAPIATSSCSGLVFPDVVRNENAAGDEKTCERADENAVTSDVTGGVLRKVSPRGDDRTERSNRNYHRRTNCARRVRSGVVVCPAQEQWS